MAYDLDNERFISAILPHSVPANECLASSVCRKAQSRWFKVNKLFESLDGHAEAFAKKFNQHSADIAALFLSTEWNNLQDALIMVLKPGGKGPRPEQTTPEGSSFDARLARAATGGFLFRLSRLVAPEAAVHQVEEVSQYVQQFNVVHAGVCARKSPRSGMPSRRSWTPSSLRRGSLSWARGTRSWSRR